MVYWIKTEEVTHLEQMGKRGKQSITSDLLGTTSGKAIDEQTGGHAL